MKLIARYKIPLMIAGAVAVLWYYLRNSASTGSTTIPNTLQSGVGTSGGAGSQTGSGVNAPAPSSTTTDATVPGAGGTEAPATNYNVSPASDLTKQSPPALVDSGDSHGSCGCQSSCAKGCAGNNTQFVDGSGGTCLASSRKQQVASFSTDQWSKYADNLKSSNLMDNAPLMQSEYAQFVQDSFETQKDIPAAPISFGFNIGRKARLPIFTPGNQQVN